MGARFEALDECVLAAASKSTGYFFAISISQKVRCSNSDFFFKSTADKWSFFDFFNGNGRSCWCQYLVLCMTIMKNCYLIRYCKKPPKIVITVEFHPLHTKISWPPTGTAVPDEKSKKFPWKLPFWELDGTEITELILNAYHSAKQSILNRTKSTVEFQGLGHLGPHMGARGKALDPRITPGFRTSGFPALISVGGANRFL